MLILIVTGGRDYKNEHLIRETLDKLLKEHEHLIVLHGGCNLEEKIGVDYFADKWCKDNDVLVIPYFADWDQFGRAAGPIRNEQMAKGGGYKATMCVTFPGGKGTKNMIAVAKKHGLEVLEINDDTL